VAAYNPLWRQWRAARLVALGRSGMRIDDERLTSGAPAGNEGDRLAADRADDTTRLEAFSDGVFAVAITLLVLNIHVPDTKDLAKYGGLLPALTAQWPQYLAYGLSFVAILIMWINHHRMFRLIARSDHTLLLLNGALLAVIVLVPFSTALLAEYLARPPSLDRNLAAVVFNSLYFVMAICFNLLWFYAARGMRLLASDAHQGQVDAITRSYRWGPPLYAVAVGLALVNAWAGVLLNVALAVYWTLPPLRRVRTA
jgi:uncharacterized membrane protein